MKEKYLNPKIIECAETQLEKEILTGSVLIEDDVSVETTGQEVINVTGFTNNWE